MEVPNNLRRINLSAVIACGDYYKDRQTVQSLILYWSVEILYTDYLRGILPR